MATLSCTCGEVVLFVPSGPVMRLECCCADCRAAHTWAAKIKGGPVPPAMLDLVYFPNALRVDKGIHHLRCFLLNEGYNTRRIVADCCWTILIGDHPAYERVRFVSYHIPAKIDFEPGISLPPVDERCFKSDMTATELAALPPEGPTNKLRQQRAKLQARKAVLSLWHDGYLSIQGLIGMIGKVELMDPNYTGPTTKWNKSFPDGPTI